MDLFEPASFRANHPPKRLLTPSLETSQCSPCSALIDLPQWESLDTNQLYISVRSFSPISPYRLLHLNELLKSEKVHNLNNFILRLYHTISVKHCLAEIYGKRCCCEMKTHLLTYLSYSHAGKSSVG